MLPNTRRAFYSVRASQRDRRTNGEIVKSIREIKPDLEIVEATGVSVEEAKARIASLPDRTIIVMGSFLFEPNGQRLDIPQLTDEFYPVANAPLFADSDMAMGKGIVGGNILSVQGAAEVVGEQLAQLLKGANPESLPVREVNNSYIVDWRQLKRWGISERSLPPGATILYRQPTAWEQYGRYIMGLSFRAGRSAAVVGISFARAPTQKERGGLERRHAGVATRDGVAGEPARRNPANQPAPTRSCGGRQRRIRRSTTRIQVRRVSA